MEINNNIKVCRRNSYSGFKKVSQMTFRSFPKLKFLNLKTLKFVQNIHPSTYVANWPLTNEHFFRKGNKQTWHPWQFHSDFTLNIWVHGGFSISFGTWITASGQPWTLGGNQGIRGWAGVHNPLGLSYKFIWWNSIWLL